MKMRKKDFWAERQELQMMLGTNRNELAEHKRQLEAFKKVYDSLTTETSEIVFDLLHERIVRETKKVKELEKTVKSLQRELDEQYSLKPATV